MNPTISDLSRITIDYLFGDRDRVIDMLLSLGEYADDVTLRRFIEECERRGIDAETLVREAYDKRDRIVGAMLSGAKVSGGEIRVPFNYAVKDKS